MIDDRQTCDVCGEEFNEERPNHEHVMTKKKSEGAQEPGVDVSQKPTDDHAQS